MNKNVFFKIAGSLYFQRFIIGVIIFAAILVGIETYPQLYNRYHGILRFADLLIQGIFTIEILIRIFAYGKKPLLFFKSGSNIFDFLITAFFYLPFGGTFASVLRLVRILRVLRLITAVPRLQVIVGALIKSVPSMGYITLLLLIQLYIFAIVGNFLFGKNDPYHFGNLGSSMFSLFKVITLEGWIQILDAQKSNPFAPIYFISFILLGTMIVLNLFIGVIMSGFDEVKREIEEEMHKSEKRRTVRHELVEISDQMELIKNKLDLIARKQRK
jgi:voltage-gated sodium channel